MKRNVLNNLKTPQGWHTFSPGRKTWDQCSNNIEALKGRHWLCTIGSINMSPLQGLKYFGIQPWRSRAGLKVCRPFRAKTQFYCLILRVNFLAPALRLPPAAFLQNS
jgi:hypothetical protein